LGLSKQLDRNGTLRYSPRMAISMTTPQPLNLIQRLFGGGISAIKGSPGAAAILNWHLSGVKIQCPLIHMLPFLTVKLEQARVILEMMRRDWPRHPNGTIRWTTEVTDAWGLVYRKIRDLNKLGTALPSGAVALRVGDQWMVPQIDLFGERWTRFSGIFPSSGSMRNGVIYERPALELRTDANGSSFSHGLFPTPTARDYKGVPGKNVQMASLPREISLLPTPNTMDSIPPRDGDALEYVLHRGEAGGARRSSTGNLREEVLLLPTPNTMDSLPPKTREQIQKHRDDGKGGDRNLREAVLYELDVDWGKYATAIRRWEEILGRPAPPPTENTGKDGKARLSPRFSEWIMGLPEGWVTDVPDLSYADQLRLIGNGVVPQQAALALEKLLAVYQKSLQS
jgi:hypothetical protein